jgi:uracil-DNA glycosylase
VIIVGQAPGSKVHASGVPWDDASGDHLREWLDVSRAQFDDPSWFGILPMGFCYPGKGPSADLPPPPICAQTWHRVLLAEVRADALVLLVGMHAQQSYLGSAAKRTLTETVRAHQEYLPKLFPLPHPSWRSRTWIKRNPWFCTDVLPTLRTLVHERRLG